MDFSDVGRKDQYETRRRNLLSLEMVSNIKRLRNAYYLLMSSKVVMKAKTADRPNFGRKCTPLFTPNIDALGHPLKKLLLEPSFVPVEGTVDQTRRLAVRLPTSPRKKCSNLNFQDHGFYALCLEEMGIS